MTKMDDPAPGQPAEQPARLKLWQRLDNLGFSPHDQRMIMLAVREWVMDDGDVAELRRI